MTKTDQLALDRSTTLRSLAEQLRARGFTESLVRARYQTSAIHAARTHRANLERPTLHQTESPIANLLALLIESRSITATAFSALGSIAKQLRASGLVTTSHEGMVSARFALLPIWERIICSPWDELPDDSSFHLHGCLPRGREPATTWLDVGTGSGFAPLLSRPGPTLGIDISSASISAARIGIALNRWTSLEVQELDLLDGLGSSRFDLISFNAPIENHQQLLTRFWPCARASLNEGGEILVHSVISPIATTPTDGELVQVLYTPESHPVQFGITRYRPQRSPSYSSRRVALSMAQPHMGRDQLDCDEPQTTEE